MLHSMKAVAAYLGVTTKTALRWEREMGLPVFRMGDGKWRSEEKNLQAWVENSEISEKIRRRLLRSVSRKGRA